MEGELLQKCVFKNGGQLLVIEDDVEILHFIEATVGREDIDFITSLSGEEALFELSNPNNNIKAIISDVVLPGIGGIGIARNVHKDNEDMAMMFITSVDDPSTNNLLWQHGLVYNKPIQEDFPAAVRRLIKCANLCERRSIDSNSNKKHGRRENDT